MTDQGTQEDLAALADQYQKGTQEDLAALADQFSAPAAATETPSAKPDESIPYLTDIGHALSSEASGVRDLAVEGPAQLLTHLLPNGVLRAGNQLNNWLRDQGVPLAQLPTEGDLTLDRNVAAREQALRAEGLDNGFRTLGRVMAPTNYLLPGSGATAAGKAGLAAGSGLVGAAATPVTADDGFWGNKLSEAAKGVGAALGLHGLGQLGSGIILPKLKEAANTLLQNDVALTLGQSIGGNVKRVEEGLKSVPVLGSLIRDSEGRAVAAFNRATINKVLEPVGESLPADVDIGHEALKYANSAVSDAFNKVLPKLKWSPDAGFAQDLAEIKPTLGDLPESFANTFKNIIETKLGPSVLGSGAASGQLAGKQIQNVTSSLNHYISEYGNSQVAGERLLAGALRDVKEALVDSIERQNPAHAAELKNANTAFALLSRVGQAAQRRATSHGVFSAGDLLNAVKQGDRSARRRMFQSGDALLQDWATAAHEVLANKLPDSGTAERTAIRHLTSNLGLGGATAAASQVSPLAAVPIALAGGLYTKPGQEGLAAFLRSNPELRGGIASAVESGATGLGRLAAPLAAEQQPQPVNEGGLGGQP